jgi:hypothetical protein
VDDRRRADISFRPFAGSFDGGSVCGSRGAGRGAVPKLRWPGRRPSRHEHCEPAQDRCIDAAGSASGTRSHCCQSGLFPPRCSSFPSWWQPRPMEDGGRHHAGSVVARLRRCVFRQGSGHVLRGCEGRLLHLRSSTERRKSARSGSVNRREQSRPANYSCDATPRFTRGTVA